MEEPRHLEVLGRTVTFPKACGTIVDCAFPELCMRVNGSYALKILVFPPCLRSFVKIYANTGRSSCCVVLYQVFLVCFVCQPLGAVDYLEMSRHFDTVLIRDVPRMNLEKKVAARRFITLIDTLYDHRVSQRQCHF